MDSGTIQDYYKQGQIYYNQMQFPWTWKECTNFKNGRQWPAKTEKTKNLPRPVINIIRYIENHKVSQILNEPVKMIFSKEEVDPPDVVSGGSDMDMVAAELFTQYAEQEWENIKQDDLNEEALEKAAELCSGIYHYYYDDSIVKGKKTISKGAIRGEILHPISVMVGNPQCLDTQLQPYILVPVRDDVDNIRNRAKANGCKVEDIAKIVGDKDVKDTSDNAKFEIKEKATEITCYWKENGYVWLMKVCNDVVTKPAVNTQHKLYPIARMNWYKEDKNWYGIGETEGLIPNQKAINFLTAMQMMKEQLVGMPKLMLKKDFIRNFNNDPATPIYDGNPNGGWSAQYLQVPNSSGSGQAIVDFLMSTTKTNSGATETATGELAKTSQMNATAIMMLQKASAVPIDQIKKRFRRTMEEIGQIWLEFWTINYNTARVINIEIEGKEVPQTFRGSDFKDVALKLKIDIGASTDYSETLMMTSLDKFLDKNLITFKQYLENAPQTVIPFKEKLLKELDEQVNNLMPEEQATLKGLPPDKQQMVLQQLQQQNSNLPTPQPM